MKDLTPSFCPHLFQPRPVLEEMMSRLSLCDTGTEEPRACSGCTLQRAKVSRSTIALTATSCTPLLT